MTRSDLTHVATQYRVPLLLVGAVALLAAVVALRPTAAPPTPEAPVAEAAPPSGDNVAPAVHARLMTLRAAAEASPDDPVAHLELARFLQDAHRYAEAGEAFEAALALDTSDRQAWLDLTNAYGALGSWDDAAATADRMTEVFPNDGAALYNAGAAYANGGRTDLATARFRDAVASPDAEMAAQARTSLERLATMEPGAPAARPVALPLPATAASGPLPAGHPPLPATADAGPAPVSADAVRQALARDVPLSARTDQ